VDTYNGLAYIYSELTEHDSALWAIDRCLELEPNEPNFLDTRGDVFLVAGDLHKAADEYRRALEIDPGFSPSLRNLGKVHVAWRQYDRADSLYRRLAAHPDPLKRANGRMELANLEIHRGRFAEALRRFEMGIQMDSIELGDDWPGFRMSKHWRRFLVNLYLTKDTAAAEWDVETLVRMALRIDSTTVGYSYWLRLARMNVAWLNAAKGNEAAAREALQALQAHIDILSEREITVYNMSLGAMHYMLGKYDSAIIHLEAMTWAGELPSQWVLLGMTYLEVGRFEDAIPLLEKHCLPPETLFWPGAEQWVVQSRYYLARSYEGAGRIPEAIAAYGVFLDHWGQCTPMIEMVRDAKARLATLKLSGA